MKRVLAVALLLCAVLTLPVAATGQVTYEGDARQFVFNEGGEGSLTDLFPAFKDVMPGDTVTQTVTVKNDVSHNVKVDLYLRSHGAHPDSEAFLSQLHLKVEDVNGTVLFDAPADETAGLTQWVYLGTLYSGGETRLQLTITVPTSLGNEWQEAVGQLDWEFKANERPVEPDDPKPPQTGYRLWWGAVAAGLSAAVIAVLLRRRRDRREE